jgi:hypothetical protein
MFNFGFVSAGRERIVYTKWSAISLQIVFTVHKTFETTHGGGEGKKGGGGGTH